MEIPPTVKDVLETLECAVGTTYGGYKGGDFRMSRQTPVWVADYGNYMIPYGEADDFAAVYITGVEDGDRVTLVTAAKQD